MESVSLESKPQPQKVDRVVLDIKSIAVVQKIADQIHSTLGDLVQLSQKDVVNFLIQERSLELSTTEIDKIKSDHFDIVRALKRATQEAIKAKQDGHEIQMDELLKIIQTPSVNKSTVLKKPSGRKSKKDSGSTQQEVTKTDDGELPTSKNIKNDLLKKDSDSKKSVDKLPFSDLKSP